LVRANLIYEFPEILKGFIGTERLHASNVQPVGIDQCLVVAVFLIPEIYNDRPPCSHEVNDVAARPVHGYGCVFHQVFLQSESNRDYVSLQEDLYPDPFVVLYFCLSLEEPNIIYCDHCQDLQPKNKAPINRVA